MSETTGISWTQATWNPWMGCTKVSPGCAHCYMFREQRQYGNDPEVVRRSKTKFNDPLKWTEPRLVFTCSWSDWFHEGADEWRDEAWEIIRATPHLTYQILTKRPERIADHLPSGWPFANCWLGVSAELQRWYEMRWPILARIEASVRFVSMEPLLGPIDVFEGPLQLPDWIIVGGESGQNHRPLHPVWVQDIVQQCDYEGIPVHVKQDSGPYPGKQGRLSDALWARKELPLGSR